MAPSSPMSLYFKLSSRIDVVTCITYVTQKTFAWVATDVSVASFLFCFWPMTSCVRFFLSIQPCDTICFVNDVGEQIAPQYWTKGQWDLSRGGEVYCKVAWGTLSISDIALATSAPILLPARESSFRLVFFCVDRFTKQKVEVCAQLTIGKKNRRRCYHPQ